ncbi:MAG: preprotein translocase subunit SecE [Bergeyella sp.]|nr:preprotein translocase subunit SecE [Bergeyella sp.]
MGSLVSFIRGSYIEFRSKVEWPKWSDLQSSTVVVCVGTVVLALFTFGVDSIFSKFIAGMLSVLTNLFK